MGQVLLVRHGQASFGAADYDALSELGFEQARLLGAGLAARGLGADLIVHGSMRRHRETAETCAGAAGWDGAEVQLDEGWNEFDFLAVLAGYDAGRAAPGGSREAFQKLFEEATAAWIAGADLGDAESFEAFTGRVQQAWERTAERARGRTVAVFSSGGPIAWAVTRLLVPGGSGDLWERLNRTSVNTGLSRVVTGSRGANLLSFNEQGHLDPVPGAVSYR